MLRSMGRVSRRLRGGVVRGLCSGPPPTASHTAVDNTADGDPVLFEIDGNGVARVILNKPIQRNPLSKDVLQKLHSVVDEVVASLASADRVRAIILSSTGTVFSAGHDFSEFVLEEGNEEGCLREHADILTLCTELNLRLQRECPPTIAAVDGLATAAGCQLVASCDLVFATRGSAFCLPGSRNGGFCHTPGVAVASKVHPRKALEMLLLSENVDAVEAQRIGLVNRLANNGEELGAMADAAAAKLVATSGHNTLRGKQGFYSHVDKPTIDAKYHDASKFMLDMFASNDQQEGIAAFFAKRPPIWRDS